jgi:hypothetical protein
VPYTYWVPPLSTVPLTVPPAERVSRPPVSTVRPLALPPERMYSRPPLLTVAFRATPPELSPNFGDDLRVQAAAVWDCEAAGLVATSMPSVNLTP